jgi:glycerol 3-phosphatase-2
MLRALDVAPSSAYDLAMLDLDGVVYVGRHVVPGVPARLAAARDAGMHLAFITNNASRTPDAVAAHLRELGVEAAAEDVVTSAQAAAHVLATRFGRGARVFLLGGAGLEQALLSEGLVPVQSPADEPVAVASGYGPDLPWRQIMQGAILVRDGLPWVASNTDHTIPTPDGLGPGHGVLVRMVEDFTGVRPTVAGKPEQALLDETVRRVGGSRPLMIGDRLDTDIEGATRAGVDSLCVLTGVTGLADLVGAPPALRPTYLAPDLAGLLEPHPVPAYDGDAALLGGWRGLVRHGRVEVAGEGSAADWWRVVVTVAWRHLDETGRPADCTQLAEPT